MKRKTFLETRWKAYPSVDTQPDGWCWGRVLKMSDSALQFSFGGLDVSLVVPGKSPVFGESIPVDCLAVGDVVALSPKKEVFLLSPNQSELPPKLSVETDLTWADFIATTHRTFQNLGFSRARTPSLVPSPGVDHHIHFLQVEGVHSGRRWTLPTSPEIHLKKLLCQGSERIYEVKTCFRDDWIGKNHQVEFEMLEWYRAFGTFAEIIQDLVLLFKELNWVSGRRSQTPTVRRVSVAELFKQHLKWDLTPETQREDLCSLADSLGLSYQKNDSWNDLFFRIFLDFIEPHLGHKNELDIVENWPASQSSLAKVEGGWARRFEAYWRGVELANAYVEENDPEKVIGVFKKESLLREKDNFKGAPEDTDFFQEMQRGMPPAVGVALGLDRLFTLFNEGSDLAEFRPFPERV